MRVKLLDDGTKQVRFNVNDGFYVLAAKAIQLDSVANKRFSTLRTIIVCGLKHAERSSVATRHIWLKQAGRSPLTGPFGNNITFIGDEVQLYLEVRRLLQEQSLERITGFATLCVALYAAVDFLEEV